MKSFAIAAFLASATLAAQSPRVTLDSLRDHQRVLLVFSNGDNRLAEAQLNVAATHSSGFRDRDLLLVGLEGTTPGVPTALLSPQDDVAARKHFRIQPGSFTVVLIGKDGGEKLRATGPITWEKLQQTIDAMPMRQDEIRQPSR